jgi:hypothetical protein
MATAHPCSLHPFDIPDNLVVDDFLARYDVVARRSIPSLGYTSDVFSGPGEPSSRTAPSSEDESSSDSEESDSDNSDDERGPPIAWPGQGTRICEDPNFLPDGPREDAYYLQFGNLTPAEYGVEGHQRCWVSHLGKRVKAVVMERYWLLCHINDSSSGKKRKPSRMILYYAVGDRDGKYMGYVSSGRVRWRYKGWRLEEEGSEGEAVIHV